MTETLDNILSGQGEAAPAPEATPETEPVAEQTEQQTEQTGDQTMVPHAALHAEKQKVKRYTEQVAEFDKSVSGLREQNAALTRQVTELLQRIPPQQPQQQQEQDFYANPEAVSRGIAESVARPHFEQVQNLVYANARLIAESIAGEDKVKEAQAAFDAAMANRTLDPADYQRVMTNPNPFVAAVKWHKRTLALQEIGDDPDKYRERVKAELLAELQGNNGQTGAVQQPAPVMPSNLAGARNVGSRTGPAWTGPPKLDDIFNRSKPAG